MKNRLLILTFIFGLILTNSIQILSQNSSETESHFHDFDFWVGSWGVYKYGTDSIVGLSEITPILNHKTIEEKYQSVKFPYEGTSNNIYNAQKKRWEQYWVDNSGLALHIYGGLEKGKMVLSNCDENICHKIIWTPNADKTVRQEWFQSNDEGSKWKKVFDGHYKPRQNEGSVKPALHHLLAYPNVRDFTISSDGLEAYVTIQNADESIRTICKMTQTAGIWSDPNPTIFSGVHKDLEPYFSPDDKRLYFVSDRPNSFDKVNYDIYYVERQHKDSLWSTPVNVGSPINTELDEYYPAIANNGNLYFTCVKPHNKGKDDIYMSAYHKNQYEEPVALDTFVNTSGYEFNCYIAPDESYIIFSGYNRPDGIGSGDLYINRKNKLGKWTKSTNLGRKINSKYMEYCPFVASNSGMLYFTSRRIKNGSKKIKNTLDLKEEVLQYENGLSRIYKVSWKK